MTELSIRGGRLRPWEAADAHMLAEAWADADVARWNAVPSDISVAAASQWIAGESERAERRLALDFVIDIDATGPVGEVGLSHIDAERRGALIGYWLLPQGRGRGLATQAADAVARWAFGELDLAVLVARCDARNIASQRVAHRAGFALEATDSAGVQLWRRRPD